MALELLSEHTVLTENDMQSLAASFVKGLVGSVDDLGDNGAQGANVVVYLEGDLGVGKSVFARGALQALGVTEAIKSPTYTLVEQYELPVGRFKLATHSDLYRLTDPEELYFIGFDDIAATSGLLLVEWPEKGTGQLPKPTHTVMIEYCKDAGSGARKVRIFS